MKMHKIVFSPTGGTQKVVDILLGDESSKVQTLSLLPRTTDYKAFAFDSQDVCVIAVPSFGGRVPCVAADRLSQMQGNGARAVLVCVYGNRAYEDTLTELKDLACAAGFVPVAAVAAVAEHSVMHQFAAGRPDEQDEVVLREYGERIRGAIREGADTVIEVPGNTPYKKVGEFPFKPTANHGCIGCGVCAAECPVGAIDPEHPQQTDAQKCVSCMRCAAVCPKKARGLNKLLLEAASIKMAKAFETRKEPQLFI